MMNREHAMDILDALAQLNRPLGYTCEKALDSIENELEKKRIRNATDLLLKGHHELVECIRLFYPDLDPNGKGANDFETLIKKYENEISGNVLNPKKGA